MFLQNAMPKYIDASEKFEEEVHKDSDIGIAIIGANIIDNMLKDLLSLVTTEKSYVFENAFNLEKYKYNPKKFFDRINKLEKLKLLSNNNAVLLHRLRIVRNVFGHELLVTNFDSIVNEDKRAYELLAGLQLPRNAYFVELDQSENEGNYIIDMNPIKADTSLQHKFIFLFNYLFNNLRWTIEYLTIENEKNTSFTEQLSKEISFNFKGYIHTHDGSFNYEELYNLRKYVVDNYVNEHIKKTQNDKKNLFSIVDDQLKKFPNDANIKKKAEQIKLDGELAYKEGIAKLEDTKKDLTASLKTYTYYYNSYKKSRECYKSS